MREKVTGLHAIEEAIKTAPRGSVLYLERSSGERIRKIEKDALFTGKITVRKLSKKEFEKLGEDVRQAVLFTPSLPTARKTYTLLSFCNSLKEESSALVLVLDKITDPNNLGAILRSADQFAVDLVIIPERRSAKINETVKKVSSGAASYVNVVSETNLNNAIELLKKNGFWIYAADMKGEGSYNFEFAKKTALIMGAEGKGISESLKKNSDFIVSIPTKGHIDSLNVSVATGILLYEIRRQKS